MANLDWKNTQDELPESTATVIVYAKPIHKKEEFYHPYYLGWYDVMCKRWALDTYPGEPYNITHWAYFNGP